MLFTFVTDLVKEGNTASEREPWGLCLRLGESQTTPMAHLGQFYFICGKS